MNNLTLVKHMLDKFPEQHQPAIFTWFLNDHASTQDIDESIKATLDRNHHLLSTRKFGSMDDGGLGASIYGSSGG